MKKKAALLLCVMLTMSMLSACGEKSGDTAGSETKAVSASSAETESASAESTEEETETASEIDGLPIVGADTPLEECITLGNYMGLELTKTIEIVSDEDVMEALKSELHDYVDDPNYEVQEGDTVEIAFVGKKDGEAFEGGTSDNYSLTIGSGQFIDGFEDGCIGMKIDETKDLNLKFPENYGNADLAGQDVVFTVTINAIVGEIEYSEEWVLENYPEYETAADFLAARKEEMQSGNDEDAQSNLESLAMQTVMDNATYLALVDSDIQRGEDLYASNYSYYAMMYGLSLEDFISTYLDAEEYEAAKKDYGKSVAQATLLMKAIANAEGWTEEDEDYQKRLENYADLYNLSTGELLEQYGEDNISTTILMDRCIDFVLENAVITEEHVD